MKTTSEKLLKMYARHFPLRRGKYRVVEGLWRRCTRGGDTQRDSTLKYGNYTMACDIEKMLQRQFYFFGTYFLEEAIIARWIKFATSSNVVFDVGANAGIYSLAAAAANAESTVNAFEPTPSVASHLRSTLAANSLTERIVVNECAVGKASGVAALNFFAGELDDNEGMNFISASTSRPDSRPVNIVSLDDFCAQRAIDRIDLIKIDVQGAEADVIAGAATLLARAALRVVFVELNWDWSEQCAATRVVEKFTERGYNFIDPKQSDKPRPAGPWLRRLSDVVAVAP